MIIVFDSQDVDELIFTDITASQEHRDPDWHNISLFADQSHMPLTMGGGIKSVEHIRKYLSLGADKIVSIVYVGKSEFIKALSMFGAMYRLSIDYCNHNWCYEVMGLGEGQHGFVSVLGKQCVKWCSNYL